MAVVAKQRIEPKVLAALVNRFTSDTAEFLTHFASQAEAKLLHLSQRLERLERLVALFEQKVHHLEPATTGGAKNVQVQVAKEQIQEATPEAAGTGPTESVTPSEPQVAPSPPAEDEKYAMYRRMHRTGVPLLAIRQKLLLDALQDPTLDVAVLDTFDGAAGTGAGAPAPKVPVAKAPEVSARLESAPPAPAEAEVTQEPEAKPEEPAAPAPLPEPAVSGGPINLAEAAAAMAQRRMSRVAAKAEGVSKANLEPKSEVKKAPAPAFSVPSKAPMLVPKAMHKEEPAAPTVASSPATANPTLFATDDTPPKAKAPIAKVEEPAEPAAPLGLFAATDDTAPKAQVRLPPPPPKAKASTAMSPEAALKLRRSVVAQVRDDDAQSDVSDF